MIQRAMRNCCLRVWILAPLCPSSWWNIPFLVVLLFSFPFPYLFLFFFPSCSIFITISNLLFVLETIYKVVNLVNASSTPAIHRWPAPAASPASHHQPHPLLPSPSAQARTSNAPQPYRSCSASRKTLLCPYRSHQTST